MLEDCVRPLQSTAKQLKRGQRDTIPAELAAVLDHFEVQQDHWLETVEQYESAFGHAVGRADFLAAVAERMENTAPITLRSPERAALCQPRAERSAALGIRPPSRSEAPTGRRYVSPGRSAAQPWEYGPHHAPKP